MVKQCLRYMVAVALVVVSGSFAKADQYSIVSNWSYGSLGNGDLTTYTGDGTFTWNGTAFSNVSFTFTETSYQICNPPNQYQPGCVVPPAVLWSVVGGNDGEIASFLGPNTLVLGNNAAGNDCAGPDCVEIKLSVPLTLGGASTPTLTSSNGVEQGVAPQPSLVSATITDLPEPSAIALLATVSGILGFVIFRRRKLVQ